jgi:hypothetical protein
MRASQGFASSPTDLQSQIRLNSNGTIFLVRRDLLVQKLKLFRSGSPELIGPDYEVKTRVPTEVSGDLVKMIEGCPFGLTEDNVGLFAGLSEEFGFDKLLEACEAFRVSSGHSTDFVRIGSSSLLGSLISRLCFVEERYSLLKREFSAQKSIV